jgi:RNA recognition motif-containing protein
MVRTKVFVGNLAFTTKEADLATAFKAAGQKVTSANIITRRSRSLGYGFVELESEEDAKNAVAAMHGKSIDGRPINVEVAKPREEPPAEPKAAAAAATPAGQPQANPRPPRPRQFARRFQNNNGNPAASTAPAANTTTTTDPAAAGGPPVRRRFRKPRAPRRGPTDQAPTQQQPVQSTATTSTSTAAGQPQGQPGPRRRRGPRAQGPEGGAPVPQQERVPRNPSKTTLFVANLPFSVEDAGLQQIFSGFAVKSAHVVRKRNGRSKGFGFVELENEDSQVKARDAIDKKVVEERPLIVKIALTENKDGAPSASNEGKADAPVAK